MTARWSLPLLKVRCKRSGKHLKIVGDAEGFRILFLSYLSFSFSPSFVVKSSVKCRLQTRVEVLIVHCSFCSFLCMLRIQTCCTSGSDGKLWKDKLGDDLLLDVHPGTEQ